MRYPAYRRALVEARLRGERIWSVRLMVGANWTSASRDRWRTLLPERRLAIKATDYRPGAIEWSCLRNARVAIEEDGSMDFGALMRLVAEVAATASPVELECEDITGGKPIDVADLAVGYRLPGRWPPWWSDAQHTDYMRRLHAWYRDLMRAIEVCKRKPAAA